MEKPFVWPHVKETRNIKHRETLTYHILEENEQTLELGG